MPVRKPKPKASRSEIVARVLATIDRAMIDQGPPLPGQENFWGNAHTVAHEVLDAIFYARCGVNHKGMRAAVAAILEHVSPVGLEAALGVAIEEEKFADQLALQRAAAKQLAVVLGITEDEAFEIIDRENDAKKAA